MVADRGASPRTRWVGGALLLGIAGVAGAVLALARLVPNGDFRAAFAAFPVAVGVVVAAPLLTALVAAAFVSAVTTAAAPLAAGSADVNDTSAAGRMAAAPPDAAALHLLALLQQEGRFVDFLEENLTPYPDEQVGAAVRSIHEGCRAALRDRLELTPILPGEEGAPVTVERGFDPAAIRITGNVRGEPPYRGVLRHPGWRTTGGVKLPTRAANHDVSILAPAEVEIP